MLVFCAVPWGRVLAGWGAPVAGPSRGTAVYLSAPLCFVRVPEAAKGTTLPVDDGSRRLAVFISMRSHWYADWTVGLWLPWPVMHDNTTMSTPFGLHDAPFFDSGHDCGGMIRSCLFAAGSGFFARLCCLLAPGGRWPIPYFGASFSYFGFGSVCLSSWLCWRSRFWKTGRWRYEVVSLWLRHHCLCELLWPHPWPWPLCMGAELYWLTVLWTPHVCLIWQLVMRPVGSYLLVRGVLMTRQRTTERTLSDLRLFLYRFGFFLSITLVALLPVLPQNLDGLRPQLVWIACFCFLALPGWLPHQCRWWQLVVVWFVPWLRSAVVLVLIAWDDTQIWLGDSHFVFSPVAGCFVLFRCCHRRLWVVQLRLGFPGPMICRFN